jgi:hypothetical protein
MIKRKGFTFIEITLFLAVTAALFIGIALGVSNSVFQQEYNDATQSFFEFLRTAYSRVSNPQSVGEGNSEYAIYGKLIVFGENWDFANHDISDEQQVFMYDVIADATIGASGKIKESLKELKINVAFLKESAGKITGIELSSPEKYIPHWDVGIEDEEGHPMAKSILIVRHPRSGTINTLVLDEAIQVNHIVATAQDGEGESTCIGRKANDCDSVSDLLMPFLETNAGLDKNVFEVSQVDFCINPYGLGMRGGMPRRDIRILSNARNASSVQLIELDNEELNEKGNRCLKV